MKPIKKFQVLKARVKKDEQGMNLIELIIAMGIGSMVILLCFAIFHLSVITQKDISTSTESTSTSQVGIAKLNKAIRTSEELKVTSPTRVALKTPAGQCQSWTFVGGDLRVKTASTLEALLNAGDSGTVVIPAVSQVGTAPYFTASGSGVTYSLQAGEGVGNIELVGNVTPRAPSNTIPLCFE